MTHDELSTFLQRCPAAPMFAPEILRGRFAPLDLSVENPRIGGFDLFAQSDLREFVENELRRMKADYGYGGYRERRAWYRRNPSFTEHGRERDIHIGVDVWVPAGTSVHAPVAGLVHSFNDNDAVGDYGPTVILEHRAGASVFHTLYGHLARESLRDLRSGVEIPAGHAIGSIGTEEENGAWPPHLHFQIIRDLGGMVGDYPGVTSMADLPRMAENCPDPLFLCRLPEASPLRAA